MIARQDAGEETRWAAAADLAEGVPDNGLKKRRTRTIVWIVVLILATWVIGVAIALAFLIPPGDETDRTGGSSDPALQRLIAQCIFLALALLVGIVGFVWARRTGRYITRWRAVASPLNRAEKKSVRRQIAGKLQADQRRLTIILAIAHQNRRAIVGVAPIYSAFVLLMISTAVASDLPIIHFLILASLLMFVVAAAQSAVAYRRAGVFIETNSKSAPSTVQ